MSVNWRHIVVHRSLNFWFSWSAKSYFYEIVVLYWAWTELCGAMQCGATWRQSLVRYILVLEDVISWSKIQMTRGTWNVSARSIDRFEQFSVFKCLCCSQFWRQISAWREIASNVLEFFSYWDLGHQKGVWCITERSQSRDGHPDSWIKLVYLVPT